MSTPTDTAGWSEGRPAVNPRRVSSIGPEEEQQMREAMHWRAKAAEHIGLSPQLIGMPVLPRDEIPESPPPAQLHLDESEPSDAESVERALSKAQTMLQLEVRCMSLIPSSAGSTVECTAAGSTAECTAAGSGV